MSATEGQQLTLDLIDKQMDEHKATRALINKERKNIAEQAEKMGNVVLKEQRRLGIPVEKDGKKFGLRMLQFQIGLRALALGMQSPRFTVADVSERHRDWLAHPILGWRATDNELREYVAMIKEDEARQ